MSRSGGFWFPFFGADDWNDWDDLEEPAAEPRKGRYPKGFKQQHISDRTCLQYSKCPDCFSFVDGQCMYSEGLEFPPCFLEARKGGKGGTHKRTKE